MIKAISKLISSELYLINKVNISNNNIMINNFMIVLNNKNPTYFFLPSLKIVTTPNFSIYLTYISIVRNKQIENIISSINITPNIVLSLEYLGNNIIKLLKFSFGNTSKAER
jgi:hypothetical protein